MTLKTWKELATIEAGVLLVAVGCLVLAVGLALTPERSLRERFTHIRKGVSEQEVRTLVGRRPDHEGLMHIGINTWRTETWHIRDDSLVEGLILSYQVRYDDADCVDEVVGNSRITARK